MALKYHVSIDGYMNRKNEYDLTPIERYPIRKSEQAQLKNLWIPSFTITCFVQKLMNQYMQCIT